MRDTQVIRDIIAVIKQGENVGIFPEAVRNWSGDSFPMDPSIAKLIKMLNVPVVVCVMKGMNLFNPRWSKKLRRTRVIVDYTLLYTTDELADSSEQAVFDKLSKTLVHSEVLYQKQHMFKVKSRYKAEQIGHALYVCPECNDIDTFNAFGNNFACLSCGYSIHINGYGFYELLSGSKLHFDNIRDWYYWQEKWLTELMSEAWEDVRTEAIFEDNNILIYQSYEKENLNLLGEGLARLFIDRIEIEIEDQDDIVLNFNDLQTINPQLNERLEIYYRDSAYRFVGKKSGVSALKWEVAVNAIWHKMGLTQKTSAYIGHDLSIFGSYTVN